MNKLFNAFIKRTASVKELICFTSKGSDLSSSFDPLGPFLEHDDKLWRQLCTIAVSQWMLTVNRGNDCPIRVGMIWISAASYSVGGLTPTRDILTSVHVSCTWFFRKQ